MVYWECNDKYVAIKLFLLFYNKYIIISNIINNNIFIIIYIYI